MSQSGPAPTKKSSQVPRSRGPRAGSSGSGNQQQDPNSNDNALSRRQSNVTFGPGPDVSPDDSISRIKTRSTWAGPNTNSDRKGSRSAREAWKSYNRSQVSKASSRGGTAWSGSGAALTENNLEQLNEANEKQKSSGGYSNQEPPSDQQEVPQSTQRGSRSRYSSRTNTNGGGQTNAQRSSRRNSAFTNGNTQASGSKSQSRGVAAVETNGSSGEAEQAAASASQSQSRQQTVAASRNVVDANTAADGESESRSKQQTVAESRNVIDINEASAGGSQSKAASRARSRRDSKMEESVQQSQNEGTNSGSGSKAPSRPSPPSKAPTSPTAPNWPGGWERKTRIITRRFPDGREVVEREVTQRPIAAV